MARQSGRWTGRAFIRGGREGIRQVSMPALVAARFNPGMKAKHQQLTCARKPARLALTAAMRKQIVLANALLKANRSWSPECAWSKTDTLTFSSHLSPCSRDGEVACRIFELFIVPDRRPC
jgi:hypothetical protein